MSAAHVPARSGRRLGAEQTDLAASLICRGTLDAAACRGGTSPGPVSPPHPVWAIPPSAPPASMRS